MPPLGPPQDRPLVTRCAWCERYAAGGRWVPETALGPGGRRAAAVTHGICPPCADALQGQARR